MTQSNSPWDDMDAQATRKRRVAAYFLVRAKRAEDSVKDEAADLQKKEVLQVNALIAADGPYLDQIKKETRIARRKVSRAFNVANKNRSKARGLQIAALCDNALSNLGRGMAGWSQLRHERRF